MPDKSDIKILFETCKARYEAAKKEVWGMLKVMCECGMAKEIEDGYGGDFVMTVVAAPEVLAQIDYFTWEDDTPEFWSQASEEMLEFQKGEIEWW